MGSISKYVENYHERVTSSYMAPDPSYASLSFLAPAQSKEEYEKSSFRNTASEIQRASKELTDMISDPSLLDKLGDMDVVEGNVYEKINQYVGVLGKYTPIVNYVELQIDNNAVKDIEIVDTPGLNDPIVSRGVVTKKFLRECDVVLLLCPCSQFMDVNTVTLMANSLPNANVNNIIVIGSKLDSGILNEKGKGYDFKKAYKKSVGSYTKQFKSTMEQLCKNSNGRRNSLVLKRISESTPMFISSICYSIDKKKHNGSALSQEEVVVETGLKGFNGFEEKYYGYLSGIKKVHDRLNGVLNDKQVTISERNNTLLSNARDAHLRIIDKIIQDVTMSRKTLATATLDELTEKKELITSIIDSSRTKLSVSFDGAAINCANKVAELRPQLTFAKRELSCITVNTVKHTEEKTVKTGFLGFRKEIIPYTVEEKEVDVSEVARNLQEYAAICQTNILSEYKKIFNREQFCFSIKRIMLEAFNKSGRIFDEDEILQPLNNVLEKISIPEIKFDVTEYIDRIDSEFPGGVATGPDIHRLNMEQEKLLVEIELKIGKQLEKGLEDISKTLETEAKTFADKVAAIFKTDLNRLGDQVNEKERYINEYKAFRNELDCIKEALNNV